MHSNVCIRTIFTICRELLFFVKCRSQLWGPLKGLRFYKPCYGKDFDIWQNPMIFIQLVHGIIQFNVHECIFDWFVLMRMIFFIVFAHKIAVAYFGSQQVFVYIWSLKQGIFWVDLQLLSYLLLTVCLLLHKYLECTMYFLNSYYMLQHENSRHNQKIWHFNRLHVYTARSYKLLLGQLLNTQLWWIPDT